MALFLYCPGTGNSISGAPFPLLGKSFATARSGQGHAGFAQRSEPFHEKVGPCQGKSAVPFCFLPLRFLGRSVLGAVTALSRTRLYLARRSASLTGPSPHIQSNCKAKGKKASRLFFRQSPYPHRACLPSVLFVGLAAVCTFGFVIKGAAILTAASCRHVSVAGQGSRAVTSKCGFRDN